MKKAMLLLGLALALTACERFDYGDCVRSEYQSSGYYMYQQVGAVQIPIWIDTSGNVCVAWEYPDGHGPKYKKD